MSKNRFVVVGAGIRGAMFARALRQNPAADLVALVDRSAQLADERGAELGVPGYSDVEKLLRQHRDLTAAVIATPDFAHREVAVRLAEAGLALLIEKPLATTVEDAEAIVDAVERSGVHAAVGFENRWNERFVEVRRQLAAGEPGHILHQIANLNDTLYVPTEMLSWAGESSPAWFLMPHTLDLATWLAQAEPVEVYARGVRRVLPALGIPTWDVVTASFTLSDGSLVSLNSSWVMPTSAPSVFDFRHEIHTEAMTFHVEISPSGVTRYAPDGARWLQFGVYERAGRICGNPINMIDDFVDHLDGAERDLPDVRQGLVITRSIAAVHESLASGTTVAISP